MTEEALSTICYARNYLTSVIAKVDFVSPLLAISREIPKKISQAALVAFPIDEPRPSMISEVVLSKGEVRAQSREFTEWNFWGLNREKRLTITPQFVLMTHSSYTKYENFRDEFCAFLEHFFEVYPDAQPSRIGLRYINEIKVRNGSPLDWSPWISGELLGLMSFKLENAEPSKIFHELVFRFESFNLCFRFGMSNPDFPAAIRRRHFVLDFDAYIRGLVEPGEIRACLNTYHSQIQRLFERSITDGLRGILNEPE